MLKKALITGGGGFIGSHIVDLLINEGWEIRIIDNFSTGNLNNLFSKVDLVEIVAGDVRDPSLCQTELC